MAIPVAVTLWLAQTSDGTSTEWLHNGGPQGIYFLGVLDGGEVILESKLPTADLNTWVPVMNGGFGEADLCLTEYTVGADTASGILKILTSTPGTYRLRLAGATSPTVWAYVIGS